MKVLLAVSGGMDSMSMAESLFSHTHFCNIASSTGLHIREIGIAHCNFRLRPGDCDKDEELVREWAAERNIPFYCIAFNTEEYAQEHNCSIETAARELRYKWFSKICTEENYDALATAHNANDNAETLLLNLIRGCGLRGACGMTSVDRLPYGNDKILLLRPLLTRTREEIEVYVREHNIPFRNDSSNFENDYRRNRIRNLVMPILKEMNPSVVQVLNEDMANFREIAEVVSNWEEEHEHLIHREEKLEYILLDELLNCKNRDYMLWSWLEKHGFGKSCIRTVAGMIADKVNTFSGKRFYSARAILYTERDRLCLVASDIQVRSLDISISEQDFNKDCSLKTEGSKLILDKDSLGEFQIRKWREGDWFIPLGMKGKKKISDWFGDIKAGKTDKEEAVVICSDKLSDSRVAAVMCRKKSRQDESTKVREQSKKILVLEIAE